MIRLNAQLQNLELVDLSAEVNHYFQAFLELTLEDTLAVFGDPDEVIQDVISGIGRLADHAVIISGEACGAGLRLSSPALKDRSFQPLGNHHPRGAPQVDR